MGVTTMRVSRRFLAEESGRGGDNTVWETAGMAVLLADGLELATDFRIA